jgi:CDP-diacylglycerol---glycerol-3-phosphate 3-phosphatidyltransferase
VTAVRDAYFAFALTGLFVAAALSYAIYAALGSPPGSERVERAGGTVLLGKPIMNAAYWALDPLVRLLAALGVSPNALTWASLALGLGAGVSPLVGGFGLACLLATCSTFCDVLDGQVARRLGISSDRGELLDAAIDRYTEIAFLGGLMVYLRSSVPLLVLALAALQACMMVSYATAKAEALHVTPPRGLMRRHERAAYLILGAGVTAMAGSTIAAHWPTLPPTSPQIASLAVVAVLGNIAAVQRLYRISRELP